MLNTSLYFHDNLETLRCLPDKSVDLIYTDPPFNTGKNWGAYDDRWVLCLDTETIIGYNDLNRDTRNFISIISDKPTKAYLIFMALRLSEMHRVLEDTGSLYLHCDQSASHYLKVLIDQVFASGCLQNEIVWCYSGVHPPKSRTFNKKHDIILWYTKSDKWVFNKDDIRVPYIGLSFNKNYQGNQTPDDDLHEEYMARGKVPETWWNDIRHIKHCPEELINYPTQKPVALLERIIKASSNEGDVVLDPFAGSGTTLDAAHGLKRKWIGIDEGQQAIETITFRLADRHGLLPGDDYELYGDVESLNLPNVEDATPIQTLLF